MAIPTLPPPSAKAVEIGEKVKAFLEEHIIPAEHTYHSQLDEGGDRWTSPPIMDELKAKAKKAGLWNLFLPKKHFADSFTNLEYASMCETMGRSPIGGEPFNCSAPDTGNMETLILYATPEQKKKWLEPLMDGTIRSAFAMTEPAVASSDATNIRSSIKRDGDHYVINGRKWWTSGAPDKRCKISIFMGQTDPDNSEKHKRQSMILVPLDTPGVKVLRSLHVFGYDDAPHGHGEVVYDNVRVPASNILLGEGRGFEIAQGRLGPGRIHHCMRTIGLAERTLEVDVPARDVAPCLRQEYRRTGRDAAVDRRVAHGDRPVAPADALRGAHDGHGRQQGSAPRDRDDQGGGAEDGAEAGRSRDPGARRRRRLTGLPPRLCVCAHPNDAHCGRPGRGARGGGRAA